MPAKHIQGGNKMITFKEFMASVSEQKKLSESKRTPNHTKSNEEILKIKRLAHQILEHCEDSC